MAKFDNEDAVDGLGIEGDFRHIVTIAENRCPPRFKPPWLGLNVSWVGVLT
jgi:hypothetical protein